MDPQPYAGGNPQQQVYVTLSGLPLSIRLEWPFRKATSGADFFVLHGDVRLANEEDLHAPVAINLSATVREVLPSLEPEHTQGPVINTLRKEVDRRQLEFLKSGKLVPVHFSSRHWDFQHNKWVFGQASDRDLKQLVARKVYWQWGATAGPAWVGDPTEALYVESSTTHLLDIARELERQGLVRLADGFATASAALLAQGETMAADVGLALEELEKKHAFERG
ncbi:MAG TPA: hypothetical protein VEK33_02255 [Terriglobales bacterium]|nr:hypothetical protein [Terriglobales bacterium]